MKIKSAIALALVIGTISGICGPNGGTVVADNPLNRMGSGLTPAQTYQNELIAAQMQRAATQAAAEKKAQHDAEVKAEWDSAVKSLTDPRDQTLEKLMEEKDSKIEDLKSRADALLQKAGLLRDEKIQSDADVNHQLQLQMYVPTDPWRTLDGKVCYAKGLNWVEFVGEVLEVKPSGIFVYGHFGPPREQNFGERDYFVSDFPRPIADGETITSDMKFAGFFSGKTCVYTNNNTINGGVHTIREIEYGKICDSPPPDLVQKYKPVLNGVLNKHPEIDDELVENKKEQADIELKRAQIISDFERGSQAVRDGCDKKISQLPSEFAKKRDEEAAAKRQVMNDKVLKSNQDLADKGDAYGLMRMGERYRDGEGVEKDLAKARTYLQKASDAGSITAAEDLSKLTSVSDISNPPKSQ